MNITLIRLVQIPVCTLFSRQGGLGDGYITVCRYVDLIDSRAYAGWS